MEKLLCRADVIIVGAGPAGCGAAYDLVKAGLDVLLLDKKAFPRLKPCAGGLTVKTLRALRYSVAPVVKQRCNNLVIGTGLGCKRTLTSKHLTVAMTVRSELDQFCLEKCIDDGVRFEINGAITAIEEQGGDWCLHTAETLFRSRYLIAADGANSRVRQLLCPGSPLRFGLAVEACVPLDARTYHPEFFFGYTARGYAWVFPKGDHLNIGLYGLGDLERPKHHLKRFCRERLNLEIEGKIVGHRLPFATRFLGTKNQRVYFIGDAAGLVEPIFGEGIYTAVRSGQIAAETILAGERGRPSDYQKRCKEITRNLKNNRFLTVHFYKDIARGYRLLGMPVARYCLMKGYAMGWTLREIQYRFPFLPMVSPDKTSLPGKG